MTNAENVYAISPGMELPAPSARRTSAGRRAATPVGQRNVVKRLSERRSAPGDERPDSHEQEQRKPEDAQEEVVVLAAEHDRFAA